MKIINTLAAAVLASLALAGCGGNNQQVDDVDYATYCADHLTNTVAPAEACQVPNPRYQLAYADTGHHIWNNGVDVTPNYAFVPIGRPLPVVIYTQPYNYAYHRPLVYSAVPVHRAVSVPYKQYVKTAPKLPANAPKAATVAPAAKPAAPAPAPAKPAPNPGIQRGGLGVPSATRAPAPPAKAPSFSGRSSSTTKSGVK